MEIFKNLKRQWLCISFYSNSQFPPVLSMEGALQSMPTCHKLFKSFQLIANNVEIKTSLVTVTHKPVKPIIKSCSSVEISWAEQALFLQYSTLLPPAITSILIQKWSWEIDRVSTYIMISFVLLAKWGCSLPLVWSLSRYPLSYSWYDH